MGVKGALEVRGEHSGSCTSRSPEAPGVAGDWCAGALVTLSLENLVTMQPCGSYGGDLSSDSQEETTPSPGSTILD